MRRLKCEKETIILTNEDDGFYDVYKLAETVTGLCWEVSGWLLVERIFGGWQWNVYDQKRTIVIEFKPPYSKDRIHKATERIIEEQKE